MKKIRPRPIDLRSMKLSAEEGFVLSRIDAPVSFSELVDLCGLGEQRVGEIVERLAAEGAVEVDSDAPASAVSPASARSRPSVQQSAARPPAPSFAGIDELGGFAGELDQPGLLIAVCGVTDVGVVRSNNEDAFAVIDLTNGEVLDVSALSRDLKVGSGGVLLAVSDGMGGQNAGEVASALTLETLEKRLSAGAAGDDVADRLKGAVEDANLRVAEAAGAPGRSGMGATLVVILIEGSSAHIVEVGDSRAYVLRRGELTQLTKDQTQIQILLDQGLLTPETAKTSRAKNIVLQAIGKTSEMIVAQRRLALRHGDRLLLCSDGLTGHVPDAEIAQVLGSAPSLAEACAQLVKMTNERGGRDNVTVVAAEITCSERGAETVEQTLTTIRAFSVGEGAP